MQLDLCLSLFDTKTIDTLCFAKNLNLKIVLATRNISSIR